MTKAPLCKNSGFIVYISVLELLILFIALELFKTQWIAGSLIGF
jgi:hypothetical protein